MTVKRHTTCEQARRDIARDRRTSNARGHAGIGRGKLAVSELPDRNVDRFFALSNDLLCIVGFDGTLRRANPALERLIGRPEEELRHERILDYLHPDDRAALAERLRRIDLAEPVENLEVRFRCADGTYRWLSWSAQPDRRARELYAVGRDITERKRAEDALRASERNYRTLFETIDEGYLTGEAIRDECGGLADYRILEINPAFEKMNGRPAEEIVGRTIRQIAPDIKPVWFDVIDRVISERRPVRLEHIVEGSGHWYDCYFGPVGESAPERFVAVFTNVTERKRAEEALRASEARFRSLVSASNQVLYRHNADWSEMRQLTGGGFLADTTSPDPNWFDAYIHPDDQPQVWAAIQEAIRTKSLFELEHRVRRADGTLGWTLSRSTPVFDEHGEIVEWFGAASDVTARKQAEEERERARQEAEAAVHARDEFLSIASHELRNPIAAIKATAQLMQRLRERGRLDEDRLARYTRTLTETSERLALLVDDLLDVSRLQSGRFPVYLTPVDLAALVRRAVEIERVGAGQHRLRLQLNDVPVLRLDADRMRQVIVNLLDNAVKYSPDGGEVRILLSHDDKGVWLRVRDEGIGLPADALETIFEPFGRAPNAASSQIQGMGLGLYIARRIVEAHGGKLWAESAGEGKGTTMCLWLSEQEYENGGPDTPRAGGG